MCNLSTQLTDGDVDEFARTMLETKHGIGMTPPFYAETASMKGNQSWPYWMIRNTYCNSLGFLLPHDHAERLAAAMNRISTQMEDTKRDLTAKEDDTGEYYVLTEDALQYLPEEWRNHFQARAEDGRVILKSVDKELSQLVRLLNSFATLVTLRYVQKRLSAYKFEPEMGAFLELELLITAFVVTYARLHHGGQQSGFSRDSLPEKLRSIHDEVLDLRNKRFAHHDEHDSVSSALEIFHEDNRFEVKFGISFGFYVGGRTEWPDLVKSVEALYNDRIEKLLERLKLKTGHDWALQEGPPPEDLDDATVTRHNVDYDSLHFALRYFIQEQVLGQASARKDAAKIYGAWLKEATSPKCELDYAIMALAQHYGIPTPGLDVTTDLHVAAWFATNRFDKKDGRCSYQVSKPGDWNSKSAKWPIIFVGQTVTHSVGMSLQDCQELEQFGLGALRPKRQKALFFHGGHSDHQNRMAETLVCAFRLAPGLYPTDCDFDQLFPPPEEDKAYKCLLEFGGKEPYAGLGGKHVQRFH